MGRLGLIALGVLAAGLVGSPQGLAAGDCAPGAAAAPSYCVDLAAGGFAPGRLVVSGTVSVYFHNSTGGFVLVSADGGRYLSNPLGPGQTSSPFTPVRGTNDVTGFEQDGAQPTMVVVDRPPTRPPGRSPSAAPPPAAQPSGPSMSAPAPGAGSSPPVAGSSSAARQTSPTKSRSPAASAGKGSPAPPSAGGAGTPVVGAGFQGAPSDPVGLPAALAAIFLLGTLSALARVLLSEAVDEPRAEHGG